MVKAENRAAAAPKAEEKDEDVVTVNYITELENRVRRDLGRLVKITEKPKKKTIEIEYQDNEDLEELLKKLCGDDFFEEG